MEKNEINNLRDLFEVRLMALLREFQNLHSRLQEYSSKLNDVKVKEELEKYLEELDRNSTELEDHLTKIHFNENNNNIKFSFSALNLQLSSLNFKNKTIQDAELLNRLRSYLYFQISLIDILINYARELDEKEIEEKLENYLNLQEVSLEKFKKAGMIRIYSDSVHPSI